MGRGRVKTQNTSIDLDLDRVHGFWFLNKALWERPTIPFR